jgi:hypothetical protein
MFAHYFKRITTPAEKEAEIAKLAAHKVAPSVCAVPRPVGRPPKKRELAAADESDEQPTQRRRYVQWFATDLIHEILRVYKQNGRSATDTVRTLQLRGEVYADLTESTVRTWFESDGLLKPNYAALLAARQYNTHAPRESIFAAHPDVEEQIKAVLLKMRDGEKSGICINIPTVRWVMQAHIRGVEGLEHLQLSKAFISRWASSAMDWSFRRGTTAASKLPRDWMEQGKKMAMSIASHMQSYGVHPSLVINFDQAGLNLIPASSRTYEKKGSSCVPITGADDKRQITVVVGSSLDGNLLPLQLIFQGKLQRVMPQHTSLTREAGFHLTCTENHWTNQRTMQEYLERVIEPYRLKMCEQHLLRHADAHVILLLDCYSVHISEEFRSSIPPHIHLIYVPPNCTSKLQPADVALNFPFKHEFKRLFNQWAAEQIEEQIGLGEVIGLKHLTGLANLRPLVLNWAYQSWWALYNEKQCILKAWQRCVFDFYDVYDLNLRCAAMAAAARRDIKPEVVPEEKEEDYSEQSDDELEDDVPIKQLLEMRVGVRKSDRVASAVDRGSFVDPELAEFM